MSRGNYPVKSCVSEMDSTDILSSPPVFDRRRDEYSKWKKLYSVWSIVSKVAKKTRGGLIILSLDEETREEVLEQLAIDDLKGKNSEKRVITVLDEIFKKDESITAYKIYEEFELYTRPANCAVSDYCKEFHRKYQKVKGSGNELSEPVLAYRLLKSANLNETDVKLIIATVPQITYDEMSKQLQKTFVGEIPSITNSCSKNSSTKKRRRQNKCGQSIKDHLISDKSEVGHPKFKKVKGNNPVDSYGNMILC